ncbi:MAG: hypothetical protein ACI4OU_02530 [Candidatus Enterenecus sp.]
MTDLMQTLYCFAQENRITGYLEGDSEYHSACRCAEKRKQLLLAALTPEQAGWLDDLLGELQLSCWAETEAAFRAGFAMAMELSRA